MRRLRRKKTFPNVAIANPKPADSPARNRLFVDFPTPLLLAMLERIPAWGLAGGLVGLGAALVWFVLRQDRHESGHDYL